VRSADEYAWSVTDDPAAGDAGVVDAGLAAFNHEASDLAAIRRLACFAKSPAGEVVAGAVGRSWGTAFELQQMWVRSDLRRQGLGSRLVRRFEEAARGRGATLLYLDTFTFQAPAFYEKLGFRIACELPGFPQGSKFILTKPL
jgi:GNAT superfamily N-acetyltransferase